MRIKVCILKLFMNMINKLTVTIIVTVIYFYFMSNLT